MSGSFDAAKKRGFDVIRRLIVCKRENRVECMIELC